MIENKTDLYDTLTVSEFKMLERIISQYNPNDVVCYTDALNYRTRALVASLMEKGLVYDSFSHDSDIHPPSYTPTTLALGVV
jgi:hypothetical protein